MPLNFVVELTIRLVSTEKTTQLCRERAQGV
jgi:hypothetical protein